MSTWWNAYPITESYNPGGGEYGEDVATPFHTQITAPYGGTVFNASYQPWGGEVGIQANVPGVGLVNEYVQHLDQLSVQVGQTVSAGQLLGLSGGQTSGGSHPASPQYSSGPHTEVGFGAPWIGGGQNFNPAGALNMATNQSASNNPISSIGNTIAGVASGIGTAGNAVTSGAAAGTITGNVLNLGPISIPLPSNDFWIRGGLVLVGIVLLVVGVYGLVARPEINIEEAVK